MSLLRVTEDRFETLVSFIQAYEYFCISLTSQLLDNGRFFLPDASSCQLYELGTPLQAVLLLNSKGVLYHCFAPDFFVSEAAKKEKKIVSDWLKKNKVRCILGEQRGSLWLESLLPSKPYRMVDYDLLCLQTEPKVESFAIKSSNLFISPPQIMRAQKSDAQKLFPLQEGYEKEEVLPPGDPFNPALCLFQLEQNIQSQIINFYALDAKPIAKAGTNAQGYKWDQLGGVFTNPEYRGLGLARSLVAHTAQERLNVGKNVALFVKKENESAQRAYKNVGFSKKDSFRIVYV